MTEIPHVYGYGYGAPGHPLMRVDGTGRSISLVDTPPSSGSVLFTGPPGMGKTAELNRFQAFAQQQGWPVFRVDASAREGLENRFARAVGDDLGMLRKEHGFWATRKLKKTLRDLFRGRRNAQHGIEARTPPILPTPQLIYKYQFDANSSDEPTSTLNELSERVGELAARKHGRAVIMIDNVDRASPRDLAAVVELTEHLERNGQPVMLVASGGERTPSLLMRASRGMGPAETDILQHYDIRECRAFTADELRPALAAQFGYAGVRVDPAAMQFLLDQANGSPQRLQQIGTAAVEYGQRWPNGLDQQVANAAVRTVDERSKYSYKATWDNSDHAERDLITRTLASGQLGTSVPHVKQEAGPDKWHAVEEARQSLLDRGVLRESNGRLRFADPGFERWTAQHLGDSLAHQAVPVQQVLSQQQQSAPRVGGSFDPAQAPPRAGGPVQPGQSARQPAGQGGPGRHRTDRGTAR